MTKTPESLNCTWTKKIRTKRKKGATTLALLVLAETCDRLIPGLILKTGDVIDARSTAGSLTRIGRSKRKKKRNI